MFRRLIHFRHPEHAHDVPLCNPGRIDCLTSERPKEIECRVCRAAIRKNAEETARFALQTAKMYNKHRQKLLT